MSQNYLSAEEISASLLFAYHNGNNNDDTVQLIMDGASARVRHDGFTRLGSLRQIPSRGSTETSSSGVVSSENIRSDGSVPFYAYRFILINGRFQSSTFYRVNTDGQIHELNLEQLRLSVRRLFDNRVLFRSNNYNTIFNVDETESSPSLHVPLLHSNNNRTFHSRLSRTRMLHVSLVVFTRSDVSPMIMLP